MKRAPRSRQRHDLYAKYHDYDSEISDLLGECGIGCLVNLYFLIQVCDWIVESWKLLTSLDQAGIRVARIDFPFAFSQARFPESTHHRSAILIEARALTKAYMADDGPLPVLDGVSLTLEAGETLALTGESGSGKSTLLHLLAALDVPDSGAIRLKGTEITGLDDAGRAAIRRERVGLVFQQFNLIPSLDVAANLAFQARLAGRYDPDWCAALANRLGLAPLLARFPEQLSGGQQQRVAIGRALAPRPSAARG